MIFGEIDLKLNLIQLESLKGISFKRIDRNKTSNLDEKINKFISSYEVTNQVVPNAVIENVPIFPGCEKIPKSQSRGCFQNKITEHIRKNMFNIGIQGRVYCHFIIDVDGFVKQIRVRGIIKFWRKMR